MKKLWLKLLPALLIAVLLLSSSALTEEMDEIEAVEPVDELVEEQSVDISGDITLGEDEIYSYSADTYAAAPGDEMFAAAGEVAINATNFPDANFRDEVSKYDADGNGSLSASEIANVKGFSSNVSIKDYTGIKFFTSLESLEVSQSATTLDVSGCTSLTKLYLFDATQLTSLNASGCTGLTTLYWSGHQLTTVNLSGCTGITDLDCGNNQLTSLNLSGCTSLTGLTCTNNQLTTLDLSSCTNLIRLLCDNNQLTSLDIGDFTNLTGVYCAHNQLTSLDVSKLTKLTELSCEYNQLTSLSVPSAERLHLFACGNNLLTSLSLDGTKNITVLDCSNNRLNSLNLSGCKEIMTAKCGNNKFKKLDISNNTYLVKCYNKGTHTTANGVEHYETSGWNHYTLEYDKGVKLTTTASKSSKSSSSSSSKTKLANKKLKVTAYVGTPVQMDTNGETGKSFKSSDKKIATVNSAGVVTPKSAGKCKITYKTSSASYTVTLTVKDLTVPKWVALNLKGTIAAKVGVPQTLTAMMNDGAVSKLKWTTSDKKIATVKNGVVTFKKKGTVTITVTTVKGNKKAKVKFKVTK